MIKFSLNREPASHDEHGRPWYDTKDGIAKSLASLEGLNKMIAERHTAGYQREERLNEFYFFGRFSLDTCGNCGKAHGFIPKNEMPKIPDVLTRDEFWAYVKEHSPKGENTWISFGMGSDIPDERIVCPYCSKGWEVGNCHDTVLYRETEVFPLAEFVSKTLGEVRAAYSTRTDAIYFMQSDILVRNDKYIDLSLKYPNSEKDWEKTIVVNERGWMSEREGITNDYIVQEGDEGFFNVWKYYHGECNRLNLAEREGKQFKELFKKAGFIGFEMQAIPNQYCPCEFCAPWYNVHTQFGTFTIGWRKRVINIDWDNVLETMSDIKGRSPSLISLFKKEGVTKGKTGIHAWGWDKAQDYLTRIHNHIAA